MNPGKLKNSIQTAKAFVFDFDGTLTYPGSLDFKEIRSAIGCPSNVPVLEFIERVEDAKQRQNLSRRLEQFEIDGAAASVPNKGAESLVRHIKGKGLPMGILTRNSRVCVMRAFENFQRMGPSDFDLILTRDEPVAPKPSGQGVIKAAKTFGVDTAKVVVVGDFIFDIMAGNDAGALTVFLDNGNPPAFEGTADYDLRINSLDVLEKML